MAFKMKGFSAFTRTDDDIVEVPGGDGLTVDVNTGEVIKPKLKMTKETGRFMKYPTPNTEKDELQPPRKERKEILKKLPDVKN